MIYNFFIAKIDFYKIEITLPAFVPKTIIVIWITVEINEKPIAVTWVLPVLENVLKCPKSSSDVVEYAVKNNFDVVFV